MSMRTRNSALLFKLEGTEGQDAAPSAATDGIRIENLRHQPKAKMIKSNEVSGSLDGEGSTVGGMTYDVSFDVYLKGSGAAGTPPEWGDLLKACGWAETITNAAIPVAAEAATAGSATTLTLGAGATGTAQLYRGMPLLLTGNPAAGAVSFITDYTAGKLAALTDSFDPVLSVATNYQIPANVLYSPASIAIPSGTFYLYEDGVVTKVVGARGTFTLSLESGGLCKASFQFSGMFLSETDAAVPAVAYDQVVKPVWRGGKMVIGGRQAAVQSLSFNIGNQMTNPDNPNAQEGFDPAEITSRDMTGSVNPKRTLVATNAVMAQFRAGTEMTMGAMLGAASGNRIGLVLPRSMYTDRRIEDRQGLQADGLSFEAKGQDCGAFLSIF